MSHFQRLHTALTQLAACLCADLEEREVPACFCGVVTGEGVVNEMFGECDERDGMAWVRLVNSYPAASIGAPLAEPRNYKGMALGADLEVGIQRTVVANGDNGTILEADHAAMVALEIADMQSVYRAVACCAGFQTMGVVVGTWRPLGPIGLTFGGMLPIYVAVD